jgi:menaquinone-dependent protoporphyrinogen oxidase
MTKVLVTYGSKMGGTKGLAEAVAGSLRLRDITVDLRPADEVGAIGEYSGLIVGSAIYTNRWRPEVVRLLARVADAVGDKPVWLFHSGPLGTDAAQPQALPKKVALATSEMNVVDVRTFGGRLPDMPKGLIARMLARKQAGDFRDFDDVDAWSQAIADEFEKEEHPVE